MNGNTRYTAKNKYKSRINQTRATKRSTSKGRYSNPKAKKQGFSERMSKLYSMKKQKLIEKRKVYENPKFKQIAKKPNSPNKIVPYNIKNKNKENTGSNNRFASNQNIQVQRRNKTNNRKQSGNEKFSRVKSVKNGLNFKMKQGRGYSNLQNNKNKKYSIENHKEKQSKSKDPLNKPYENTQKSKSPLLLVNQSLKFKIQEEEEPSIENHLSINGDDMKIGSSIRRYNSKHNHKPTSANSIVRNLNLQKLRTQDHQSVNPSSFKNNLKGNGKYYKNKKKLEKFDDDFQKKLNALAPSENKRIDEIIGMMNSKQEKSFRSTWESILNVSIEEKNLSSNNYLSNTKEEMMKLKSRKDSHITSKTKNSKKGTKRISVRSIQKKEGFGYYERLKKKKILKQADKKKMGISNLTPEMHKKVVRNSIKKMSLLSQRSQKFYNNAVKFKKSLKRELSKKSMLSFTSAHKNGKSSQRSVYNTMTRMSNISTPTNKQQIIIEKSKLQPKMTIQIPQLINPKTKRQNRAKVSPKIKIMNTVRNKGTNKFQQVKVSKNLNAHSSSSQNPRAKNSSRYNTRNNQIKNNTKNINIKKKGKEMNIKTTRSVTRSKYNSNVRKGTKKQPRTKTAREFNKLNDSDHKKLNEIKEQFKIKMQIDTSISNKSASRSKKRKKGNYGDQYNKKKKIKPPTKKFRRLFHWF